MNKYFYLLVVITFILLFPGNGNHLFAAEQDIRLTIANDVATANTLEFDLLLFDPDPNQDFQLCTVQAGIYVNPSIFIGGTVTVQILAGTSTLNAVQVPTTIGWTASQAIIKLPAKAPPGCGSGTVISKDAQNPTRICRIRMTVSTFWTSCTTANLAFCFTTTPYPTKISYYQSSDCIQAAIVTNSSNCFSNATNLALTYPVPSPVSFNITGSGSYCPGGNGLPVGLTGSEADVTYILYKNGTALSPVYQGTGSALNFGIQAEGTYTITGQRPACGGYIVSSMSGSAVLSLYAPTVGGTVSGPDSAVEGSSLISLSLSGNTGAVIKWQKRLDAGNWLDISSASASYSEVPTPVGTWEYRAVVQNGTCLVENSASKTVIVTSRKLTVKLFLQGLYRISSGLMDKAQDENGDHFPGDIADLVDVSLASNTYPYTILFTIQAVALPRNGIFTLDLPSGSYLSYYLVINHRNSVETWSSIPFNLGANHTDYNFTNGVYKAYGYNMLPLGSVSVLYTGDVNQDGIIDSGDMITISNESASFATGYLPADANGDGLVDSGDMIMVENNSSNFIGKITP